MTVGAVDDVVSTIGLWWPEADEDAVRHAAAAWQRTSIELDRAVDVGHRGLAQARARWSGAAADGFAQAWREHETALRDDSAACLALSAALLRYADAVADAKRRVEEIAVTAGATIVAGLGLAWLTFGASAGVAAGVSASLVAAATAVGVELSATAAAIIAGAGVGITFGMAEAAVVDMAVTQPLRVEAFDDGGYSATEVGSAAVSGGMFGGVLGGASAGVAAAPIARTAAGELGALRAPGGAIRGALDPANWGQQGRHFLSGVDETAARFRPHEIDTAQLLAEEGKSVHARPEVEAGGVKNPDALVRTGPADPGTYTEFKAPGANTSRAVLRSINEAYDQLWRWGGGEAIVDGRAVGLTREVVEEGVSRAAGKFTSSSTGIPDSVRILLADGSEVRYSPE